MTQAPLARPVLRARPRSVWPGGRRSGRGRGDPHRGADAGLAGRARLQGHPGPAQRLVGHGAPAAGRLAGSRTTAGVELRRRRPWPRPGRCAEPPAQVRREAELPLIERALEGVGPSPSVTARGSAWRDPTRTARAGPEATRSSTSPRRRSGWSRSWHRRPGPALGLLRGGPKRRLGGRAAARPTRRSCQLVAVAAGGVPSDLYETAKAIDGGAFSGLNLAVLVGLARAYDDPRALVDPRPRRAVGPLGRPRCRTWSGWWSDPRAAGGVDQEERAVGRPCLASGAGPRAQRRAGAATVPTYLYHVRTTRSSRADGPRPGAAYRLRGRRHLGGGPGAPTTWRGAPRRGRRRSPGSPSGRRARRCCTQANRSGGGSGDPPLPPSSRRSPSWRPAAVQRAACGRADRVGPAVQSCACRAGRPSQQPTASSTAACWRTSPTTPTSPAARARSGGGDRRPVPPVRPAGRGSACGPWRASSPPPAPKRSVAARCSCRSRTASSSARLRRERVRSLPYDSSRMGKKALTTP